MREMSRDLSELVCACVAKLAQPARSPEDIRETDELFDLGFDSVRVVALISALEQETGTEIMPHMIYVDSTSTVGELIKAIRNIG